MNTRKFEVPFEPHMVYKYLIEQPSKTTFSADFLNQLLLKKCALSLAHPLSLLFQESYDTAVLPKQWKTSFITPVYKKGLKCSPDNYRPISITSAVCRVMEKMIAYHIRTKFSDRFSKNQFGFIEKRSCNLALLSSIDSWKKKIHTNKSIDVVYFDFRKAFDKVSHAKLLYKLESFGLDCQMIRWFKTFLTNRKSFVRTNNALSERSFDVTSGVLQGTVTGPLLFLIFINDLSLLLNSHQVQHCFFADDLKIYDSNPEVVQDTIDLVYEWSVHWRLPLAQNKINVLHLGAKNTREKYYINGNLIEPREVIRDLGVMIDEKLNFECHINQQIAKASAISAKILRSFLFGTPEEYMALFNTYVSPVLLYCSEIYCPSLNSHSCLVLEGPLRRFTATAFQKCRVSYESYTDRLSILNERPFYFRRAKFDLLQAYKIRTGLSQLPIVPWKNSNLPRDRHRLILCDKISDTNWFFPRVLKMWNSISKDIGQLKSVEQFKTYLDVIDIAVLFQHVPFSLQ